MVPLATEIITSELTGKPSPVPSLRERKIPYYGVKEAAFPFNMFQEVDPVLGPEMRSTGEVLGLADTYGESFCKSQEGVGLPLPLKGTVLISLNEKDKPEAAEIARKFSDIGFSIVATGRTYMKIVDAGIRAEKINKIFEGSPDILDAIEGGKLDLIINTPIEKGSIHDDSYIRKAAIRSRIPYITTIAAARATAEGIRQAAAGEESELKSVQELHRLIEER